MTPGMTPQSRPHYIIIPNERVAGEAYSFLVAAREHANFYCPNCGDIWARAVADDKDSRHHFYPRRCVKCGNGTLGVFFTVNSMSHSLLFREALVLLTTPTPLANNGLPE